jgi:hypothetical protein
LSQKLKLTRELRESWQCRCLAESRDRLWRVVLAVLAHNFADALLVLLKVTYPNFAGLKRPLILGGATIERSGKITCDVIKDGAAVSEREVIYDSQHEMIAEFRLLADLIKVTDAERLEMFVAIQAWIVADARIDHNGRRLAS